MMVHQRPPHPMHAHPHPHPPHPHPHPPHPHAAAPHKADTNIFSSAIKALSQCRIPSDSEDVLRRKTIQAAKWIKQSNHIIVVTGAGISPPQADDTGTKPTPTLSHMALVKLHTEGRLKYIVTQNSDGLHHTSGIDPAFISELHGNIYTETCVICGKVYLRDYTVEVNKKSKSSSSHRTGRACLKCGGGLQDNLVKQQAPLPQAPLTRGLQEAEVADLCIVLGSDLVEEAAANIATKVAQRGKKLIICNSLASSLDEIAAVRINAKPDIMMSMVMHDLRYTIPTWKLRRRVMFAQRGSAGKSYQLEVQGRDYDHVYASILKTVKVKSINGNASEPLEMITEPFIFSRKEPVATMLTELHFIGSYNEPPYELEIQLNPEQSITLDLFYNPYKHVWEHAVPTEARE